MSPIASAPCLPAPSLRPIAPVVAQGAPAPRIGSQGPSITPGGLRLQVLSPLDEKSPAQPELEALREAARSNADFYKRVGLQLETIGHAQEHEHKARLATFFKELNATAEASTSLPIVIQAAARVPEAIRKAAIAALVLSLGGARMPEEHVMLLANVLTQPADDKRRALNIEALIDAFAPDIPPPFVGAALVGLAFAADQVGLASVQATARAFVEHLGGKQTPIRYVSYMVRGILSMSSEESGQEIDHARTKKTLIETLATALGGSSMPPESLQRMARGLFAATSGQASDVVRGYFCALFCALGGRSIKKSHLCVLGDEIRRFPAGAAMFQALAAEGLFAGIPVDSKDRIAVHQDKCEEAPSVAKYLKKTTALSGKALAKLSSDFAALFPVSQHKRSDRAVNDFAPDELGDLPLVRSPQGRSALASNLLRAADAWHALSLDKQQRVALCARSFAEHPLGDESLRKACGTVGARSGGMPCEAGAGLAASAAPRESKESKKSKDLVAPEGPQDDDILPPPAASQERRDAKAFSNGGLNLMSRYESMLLPSRRADARALYKLVHDEMTTSSGSGMTEKDRLRFFASPPGAKPFAQRAFELEDGCAMAAVLCAIIDRCGGRAQVAGRRMKVLGLTSEVARQSLARARAPAEEVRSWQACLLTPKNLQFLKLAESKAGVMKEPGAQSGPMPKKKAELGAPAPRAAEPVEPVLLDRVYPFGVIVACAKKLLSQGKAELNDEGDIFIPTRKGRHFHLGTKKAHLTWKKDNEHHHTLVKGAENFQAGFDAAQRDLAAMHRDEYVQIARDFLDAIVDRDPG